MSHGDLRFAQDVDAPTLKEEGARIVNRRETGSMHPKKANFSGALNKEEIALKVHTGSRSISHFHSHL